MGAIKKILHRSDLPPRELHNSRLFIDLSENVHIHFREIRLMFSVREFFEFAGIVHDSAKDVKRYLRRNPAYKEQEVFDGLLVAGGPERQTTPLQASPQPHVSAYFPERLQIELQEEEVIDPIHIHYRDYRFAMNLQTFREFAQGMTAALANLDHFLAANAYAPKEHPFRTVVGTSDWQGRRVTLIDRLKHRLKMLLRRGSLKN